MIQRQKRVPSTERRCYTPTIATQRSWTVDVSAHKEILMKTHKSSDSGAAHERTARLFTGDTSFKWVHRADACIIDVAAFCVFVTPCHTCVHCVSYEKNCALGIRRSNSVLSAPTRNHFARRPFSVHFCVYAAYHQLASTVNLTRRAPRRVYARTHIQDGAACDSAAAALQRRQWQSSHRSVAALPVNFPLPHMHESCCYMRSGAAVLIEDSI
jgi:hypothetical protein